MIRFFLALIASLVLAPSLAAKSDVTSDTTYESYISNYHVNADSTHTQTIEFVLRLGSKDAIERNNLTFMSGGINDNPTSFA